ncbi:MAG: nucleotide exchange factor GrpE [Clostridiales bacterium]|nr:nucleotide exchange factor GrpE [Clostridiales bacterium]
MEEKKEYEQETQEQVTEETTETADPAAADVAEDGAEQTAETPDESGEASADDAADEAADSADAADGEASDDSKADKGGFFRKKDKKDKKDEKIEELTDRVKRQMAEFDNFRKRTEKEKSQMFETGAKSIIEKVLPVIDNFERGLAAVPEEEKENPFVDGMEKIYRQMMTVLEEAGVKPIEAEGKEFDPNLHNAVMHIDDENFGENIVAEEFQKGYTYRDSVVRHSMVKVAN